MVTARTFRNVGDMSGQDEILRQRHIADALSVTPEMVSRLTWPVERLTVHRGHGLRRLLQVAIDRSPWHRRRLSGVDPERIDESTLSQLPTMTKDDLMEHFDEIVTDRRLSLDLVESHLDGLIAGGYLLGEYAVIASSGSSGRRGVFVYDREGWVAYYLGIVRNLLRARSTDPELARRPVVAAIVAAKSPTHATAAVTWTFSGPHFPCLQFPVTLPHAEIVDGLNRAQPTFLRGYTSALHALAEEARAGRLRIRPRRVWTAAEPLSGEVRTVLEETWAVPVGNLWASSEGGGLATPCDHGSSHLSEDLHILEFVDEEGAPVEPGTRAAKVLLTNLSNLALPLIRYELTDEVTIVPDPCRCGSSHRRIEDIQGRLDDGFVYGEITVHPHVFRSVLGRARQVVEYQVRQTSAGAEVSARCAGPVDLPALEAEIAAELARLGLRAPEVVIGAVERIERQSSGKLKRFVPLEPAMSSRQRTMGRSK
jgi:phenylacetate-CoA ligase